GLKLLESAHPHMAFLDIWMPGSLDGLQVLVNAKKRFPDIEFVMISGHGTIEAAVKATRLGAWDFIEKPLSMDRILINVHNIVQYQREKSQRRGLADVVQKSISLVGNAPSIIPVKQKISEIADDDRPVLIVGEKGTGKNIVAQNLHFQSTRAGAPLVEINVALQPLELIEYDLWGWERSALPGHSSEQKGKLETTAGGSLFLKGIHLLPQNLQIKLSQTLKTREFKRIRGQEKIPLEVRIIMSVEPENRHLIMEELNQQIEHEIHVPSLRDRKEDIAVLFWHFSDAIIREQGQERKQLSEQALQRLVDYPWPGNLREFRNFVERLYLLTPTSIINIDDLYFAGLPDKNRGQSTPLDFREARAQFEKQFLINKLKEFDGNISKTAEAIGLERSYLHRKLKSYGID
ncbi:MAG: sigma-54 dependent transcriptional regulator, partial [Bdellovibrionaceae bacterium]|nr:sigma-54 dependent transcriptional regulator [Pseudobdellovibrionaceae bacterium]